MKKIIRLILTVVLLVAFAATAYADSVSPVDYTPTDIMDWYIASLNTNDEQLDRLTGIITLMQ